MFERDMRTFFQASISIDYTVPMAEVDIVGDRDHGDHERAVAIVSGDIIVGAEHNFTGNAPTYHEFADVLTADEWLAGKEG